MPKVGGAVLALLLGVSGASIGWYSAQHDGSGARIALAMTLTAGVLAIFAIPRSRPGVKGIAIVALVVGVLGMAIVGCNWLIDNFWKEERTLYTCTACLVSNPTNCVTYSDGTGSISANESEARKSATAEFCVTTGAGAHDPLCELHIRLDFKCSHKQGQVSPNPFPVH